MLLFIILIYKHIFYLRLCRVIFAFRVGKLSIGGKNEPFGLDITSYPEYMYQIEILLTDKTIDFK